MLPSLLHHQPPPPAAYEIKREDDRIHKLFQDPTGQHLLVCMQGSKDCYYLGRGGKRSVSHGRWPHLPVTVPYVPSPGPSLGTSQRSEVS